jgi:hypothetical protein
LGRLLKVKKIGLSNWWGKTEEREGIGLIDTLVTTPFTKIENTGEEEAGLQGK